MALMVMLTAVSLRFPSGSLCGVDYTIIFLIFFRLLRLHTGTSIVTQKPAQRGPRSCWVLRMRKAMGVSINADGSAAA